MPLRHLRLLRRYSSNRNDLASEFYQPCLKRASRYDRAAGYFRSSVFLVAHEAMVGFSDRGGRMRLVCCPELTGSDIDAIEAGYSRREAVADGLLKSIDALRANPGAWNCLEMLAALVAAGTLEIRVAFRPRAPGVFHDKIGLFHDGEGDVVSFTGSVNETFAAWGESGNHESLDAFCSWTGEAGRVDEHAWYFDQVWAGLEPGLEVLPFPEVVRERLVTIAEDRTVAEAYRQVKMNVGKARRPLRRHQLAALEAWHRNGERGILAHATGSGKTLTALAAAREWLEGDRPVVVVVPSELLVQQWESEAELELDGSQARLLIAGAGHEKWKQPDVVEGFTEATGGPRLTIATIQTASAPTFLRRVEAGSHLLMIVDEVHRSGSPKHRSLLSLEAGGRLGLSATPYRYGDAEGTHSVVEYFGGIVHTFSLKDALDAGTLCPYSYFVHTVEMTESEEQDYQRLTERIAKALGATARESEGQPSVDPTLLFIQRARIGKKASAKVPAAAALIAREFNAGERWLAYCDDQDQVRDLLGALQRSGIPAQEYHSAMGGDKAQSLAHFVSFGGVIVAIRCLDEGVDIPTVDHAVILASSRNPREFIQRRGRLLRPAEGKYRATIHDLLILPSEGTAAMLVIGELRRAWEFAQTSANTSARRRLEQLARRFSIDLASTPDPSFEADAEAEGDEDGQA